MQYIVINMYAMFVCMYVSFMAYMHLECEQTRNVCAYWSNYLDKPQVAPSANVIIVGAHRGNWVVVGSSVHFLLCSVLRTTQWCPVRSGDGMQTAALADCERLRTNRRHAHLREPKKRLQLIYCN